MLSSGLLDSLEHRLVLLGVSRDCAIEIGRELDSSFPGIRIFFGGLRRIVHDRWNGIGSGNIEITYRSGIFGTVLPRLCSNELEVLALRNEWDPRHH